MKGEGHFTLVQLGSLSVPVVVERKWGIYRGYTLNYKKDKTSFDTIPKEKRNIQYLSASRVVALFPLDASIDEVVGGLEFLLNDLKRRQKEDPKSEV